MCVCVCVVCVVDVVVVVSVARVVVVVVVVAVVCGIGVAPCGSTVVVVDIRLVRGRVCDVCVLFIVCGLLYDWGVLPSLLYVLLVVS